MNERERKMAMIVGAGLAVAVLYYGVNFLFISPMTEAKKKYSQNVKKQNALKKLVDSERKLAKTWNDYAARTFSFDALKAQDLFGQDLKRLAKQHGFESANFKKKNGKNIGRKTKISTVGHQITTTGEYIKIVEFIRGIYQSPYLCQITKLSISPVGSRDGRGRDIVKVEFTVETPILPKIKRKDIRKAAKATAMPEAPEAPIPPFRQDLKSDSHYVALSDRNMFRAFMPPPPNYFTIVNKDWKGVGVDVQFFWEGKVVEEQKMIAIAGKGQKRVSGKGDVAEVYGSYADGKAFGPKRLDFTTTKDVVYTVAAHTPEPPDSVILFVDNQHDEEVSLKVVVHADGKQESKPKMVFDPGSKEKIGEWKAAQVKVTALYKSEKVAVEKTFKPSKTRHTLTVPKEKVIVAATPTEPAKPVEVKDPDPDGKYTVSGLLTYQDPKTFEYIQEMVITGGEERKVINSRDEGAVDTGTLLAVHPLGGVVKMPSGNFYIYPLGRSFTERILLEAQNESELAAAIDAWTRQ